MTTLEDGLNILGRIGSNDQNLDLLLKYLDRLVPFVGAGLSFDFGYPSWNKLIEDLADQAGLRPQNRRLACQFPIRGSRRSRSHGFAKSLLMTRYGESSITTN